MSTPRASRENCWSRFANQVSKLAARAGLTGYKLFAADGWNGFDF